jgi:hypothetical protein
LLLGLLRHLLLLRKGMLLLCLLILLLLFIFLVKLLHTLRIRLHDRHWSWLDFLFRRDWSDLHRNWLLFDTK